MSDIISPQDDIPLKRCHSCPEGQQWHPATTEFFDRNRRRKSGLQDECRDCRKAYRKRPDVREHKSAYNRDYRERVIKPKQIKRERPPKLEKPKKPRVERTSESRRPQTEPIPEGMKRCPSCPEGQQLKPATPEYFYRHKGKPDGLDATCKRCKNKKDRAYHQRPETKELKTGYNRTYEARKSAVPGTHTPEQIREQLKRQHYRCYYAACGFSKFDKDSSFSYGYRCHVEHTFPLSRVAGTDIPANDMGYLVLACDSCNTSKHDKFPWEWPEGGRLL